MDEFNNNNQNELSFPETNSNNGNMPAVRPGSANALDNNAPKDELLEQSFEESSLTEASGDTINLAELHQADIPVKKEPSAVPPVDPSVGALPYRSKHDMYEEKRKKRIKKRVIFGVIAGILGIVVGVICFAYWYKNYLFNKVTYVTDAAVITIVDESGNTVALSDVTETTEFEAIQDEKIVNILLIGIDSRSKNYASSEKGSRSDVIMIMSLDSNNGTIKLISIARDSYAYFPGYSYAQKINAAMSYGGPELLVEAVQNQLRIDIDGYAYVNFYNMAKVIDAVGGVYCNVTSAEASIANTYINELYDNATPITSTGDGTWLNGIQAVGYARNRYSGDGDYERMSRQEEVLQSLLKQFMALDSAGKLAAMDDILECIVTNVPQEDIEKYAFDFLPTLKSLDMQYMQLPMDGFFNCGMYGDEWSIRQNWNAEIPYVQMFLYGETTEFDEVTLPKNAPSDSKCPTLDDTPLEDVLKVA